MCRFSESELITELCRASVMAESDIKKITLLLETLQARADHNEARIDALETLLKISAGKFVPIPAESRSGGFSQGAPGL